VYWLKVHQLPQAGRNARGKPMVNLLPLEEGEKINAVLPVKQYDEQHFVFMATSQGTVKKTPLDAFSRPRSAGIIAIDLHDNDRLVGVALTDGQREVILVTSGGKAIRFPEEEVRPMGREAAGVRGVKLGDGQELIALIVVGEGHILTASEHGYGNGATVGAVQVTPGQELMLISSTGTLVRTPVDEVSIVGRNTQGVRLIRLAEGERLTGIEQIDESLDGAPEGEEVSAEVPPQV